MIINRWFRVVLASIYCLLLGCAPVKSVVTNQYKLDLYHQKHVSSRSATRQTILITQPDAVAGYQTDQMMYVKKRFAISSFAHSAWTGPPADMLLPLMLQSIQDLGYFYAVSSSLSSEQTDYRLDTQLISLQQNFLTSPSNIDFIAKITLMDVANNKVMASKIISLHIPCPQESPYGGVIAANNATKEFTAQLSIFILEHIKGSRHHSERKHVRH
jgi:cholesterol transport system auxiliary component